MRETPDRRFGGFCRDIVVQMNYPNNERTRITSGGKDLKTMTSTITTQREIRVVKGPKTMPSRQKRKKILLVDDNATALELYSDLLGAAGYEVIRAADSLEALFAAVRGEPDLVLADLRMPIMNGLALARELKTHLETHHVPVVVLTGHDSPKHRAAAFEAGCDGYLTKPLNPHYLLDEIAQLLQPKRAARLFVS